MSFKHTIANLVASGQLDADPQQRSLVDSLDYLQVQLLAAQGDAKQNLFARLSKHLFSNSGESALESINGLYIWGGVGRGKTHLMDIFFEGLPITEKWRIHFHRFMLWVHEQNGQLADQVNPLQLIAKQVSDKNKLLCLDEFMVNDIADAMILHGLLTHLYARGVVVVTTSNIPPDELYAGGIQRDSFMGAIALLKDNSHIIEVSGDKDFRTREWVFDEIYYSPLGEQAHAGLLRCYHQITSATSLAPKTLTVAGRTINAVSTHDGLAWFEFDELCRTYRSQMDYIQIANQFNTLMLANVPKLFNDDDEAARCLINLIDTAYDYQVKLLLSADAPPEDIYQGNKLTMPFKRTASRLWEMSTKTYLTAKREIV